MCLLCNLKSVLTGDNSLLSKFDDIKMENDTRLAEDDRQFCEQQHGLYVRLLSHYRDTYQSIADILQEDRKFYESVTAENTVYSGGYKYKWYDHSFVKLEVRDLLKLLGETHDKFIHRINGYFRDKYNVSIKDQKWTHYFKVDPPHDPHEDYPYSSYSYRNNMSDKEREEYDAKIEAYKVALVEHEAKLIAIELDYNPIIDDIFLLLGGFNFEEKADREIKDAALKAATNPHCDNKERFKIKNGKISFDILYSTKCRYSGEYEMKLEDEGYLSLLRALTYFDSDKAKASTYSGWLNNFTGYHKYERDGIFDIHDTTGTKVTHFKYYKNGKFEVTFDNHTSALTFAKDYLGHVA